VIVILLGPWTANPGFALIWTPAWVALSVVVLKSVWRKVPVQAGAPAAPIAPPRGRLFEPIGGRWLGLAAIALGALAYAFALVRLGTAGRFALVAITACVVFGLALAWMIEG
jgi:hypothetical protein